MMIKLLPGVAALLITVTGCASDGAPAAKSPASGTPARFRVVESASPVPASTEASSPSQLACPPARSDVPADAPLEACSTDGQFRYQLGPARLTARDIARIALSHDDTGQPVLTIHFTKAGQQVFTALTGELIGRQLAFEVDGVVLSAPSIAGAIDGDAQISGFDEAKARALLDRLGVGT